MPKENKKSPYFGANTVAMSGGIDEYQRLASITMNKEHKDSPALELCNWAMGAAGEACEIMECVKKHVFHGHELDSYAIKKEIGDTLWYLAAFCESEGWSLGEIASENIDKLRTRYSDDNGGAEFSKERSRERRDQQEDTSFNYGANVEKAEDLTLESPKPESPKRGRGRGRGRSKK